MQFLYVDLVITTSVAVLSKSAIRNQSNLNDLPYIHVARPSSFFFFENLLLTFRIHPTQTKYTLYQYVLRKL